jgi:hypothetical protein
MGEIGKSGEIWGHDPISPEIGIVSPDFLRMSVMYYIGLDIHKKTISCCVKKVDGTIVQQGKSGDITQFLQKLVLCPQISQISPNSLDRVA